MSQPRNPDARPLPLGWIEQYDPNYRAWFYVNTSVNPPQSSWQHPATYSPPPGPPRDSYGGPPPNNYGPPPQQNWGGSGGYGGPPQGNWQGGGGYNNYGSSPGPAAGGYNQQYSYGAQSGGAYEDPRASGGQNGGRQNNKPGIGLGKVALGGGAALLGGLFLEHEFEKHEEHEREEAYDAGFNQGDNIGYDDGFVDGENW